MKKIVLEIVGRDVKITPKDCAKLDQAIAARALLYHVKEIGLSTGYLEKFLGVKFTQVDNSCKLGD